MIPQSITQKNDWKETLLYILLKYIDKSCLWYKQEFSPARDKQKPHYYVNLYNPYCVMQYAYSVSNAKIIKRYMRKMIRQGILYVKEYSIDTSFGGTETLRASFNHQNKFETAGSKYILDEYELEKLFDIQGKRQVKLFTKHRERDLKELIKNSKEI
jgi:hypothetical protein